MTKVRISPHTLLTRYIQLEQGRFSSGRMPLEVIKVKVMSMISDTSWWLSNRSHEDTVSLRPLALDQLKFKTSRHLRTRGWKNGKRMGRESYRMGNETAAAHENQSLVRGVQQGFRPNLQHGPGHGYVPRFVLPCTGFQW